MIRKPDILSDNKLRELLRKWLPEDVLQNTFLQDRREIAQAQREKDYKEMLEQFVEWGNQRCLTHHTSMNNVICRVCNECWQALQSQLEEV